ncbi:sensor histidine kinase [Roseofilum casamattae]|uniref:histidine kinase n=1 Tax=Roseofilum casamattae BLCC-M143 TaxID=3022442 RepID=A0ABT7BTF6_9CYAN|nr:ATP-binding protein [Roseofilum casamattae]MDJ1182470.1 ATP-binding protein [Roseofilum casamattae BLCC-M143]
MNTSSNLDNFTEETRPTISAQHHWEADLKLIVEGIASQIGEKFFRFCVRYLAELLQVQYALIAEFIDGEEPKARILALWAGNKFAPNFEYVLAGTPCGIVIEKGLQIYDRGIQKKFPEDTDLVTMEAESYLGIAIYNSHGKIIGHLAALHTQPLNRSHEEQEAILKIFAARSAAEIERQITEQELKQQNQRLEETLMELKHTQAQLIQAEKMSSLGHMVAGIAHEINNPINFIHGNIAHASEYYDDLLHIIQLYQQEYPHPSQVIQEEIESLDLNFIQTDIKKILQSMQVGSQRISDIVKSCRNFSRLDESTFKVVDIHEGLESALMILQSRLRTDDRSFGIDVVKEYGKLPHIYCSPEQLNQAFFNLIHNAIDALEEVDRKCDTEGMTNQKNKIWIRTYLNSEMGADNRIFISIADNGMGIPDEIQAKMFDPFFTTKSVGKGTGLGLSVSYEIITNLHDGTLICNSTVGQGTEFVVSLPIRLNVDRTTNI